MDTDKPLQACSRWGTTKKIMPPGKTQDVLYLFCSFSKHLQNRRFCAEFQFGQKCVLKKNKKDHIIALKPVPAQTPECMSSIFSVLVYLSGDFLLKIVEFKV